jgi:hypothetical protein
MSLTGFGVSYVAYLLFWVDWYAADREGKGEAVTANEDKISTRERRREAN